MGYSTSQKIYTGSALLFFMLSFLPQTYVGVFTFILLSFFSLFGLICDKFFCDDNDFNNDPNWENYKIKNT